jgi:alpha-glucosidase
MILNTELEHKGNIFPNKILSFQKDVDKIHFYTSNNVVLQITVVRDSVLRFRYSTVGSFSKDFSYAISESASKGYNLLEINETKENYQVTTSKIICTVAKLDAKIKLYDALDKTLICEDELGFHWEESYELGGDIVKMSKHSLTSESFYGLGDKPCHNNLKGKRFENWVTDSYAFGKDTDPIYKAIPFYIGLHTKKAYGIFFDNTFKTFFDFCQERRNVTSFWSMGGEMNYYYIYGPEIESVIANYTDLTGRPKELPPLWALGYHQCKWSYYPESNVREVTSKFRALKIPCDAIYLDIDYMDGFRCFTWNKEYFPNPKQMVSDLAADGFKTIVIIDPGIKIDPDYWVYKEGLENKFFCRRGDGPYVKGKVWPGECYFPDFTNPKVREWWAGLFKELIEDIGVKGVWNDMNEPAVMDVPGKSFPNDVRHNYDGSSCSHRKAHNIYGMQMARATYKGLKRYTYPKRPFVITRAAYSGTQRYSSTWTGDNIATWEHLQIANAQVQRLCISGFSFAGSDIGGFAEQPNGELYARWIQLGVFHPFCRTHSSGDHGDQEPYAFGTTITDIVRKFIEIRYQLLPYLYTAFWKHIEEGIPIIKSLVVFDQEDQQTYFRDDEFIYGDSILVCPIVEPNSKGRRMYFPKGNWYNYFDNKLIDGGEEHWVDADIDSMPVYVLEGTVIPKYPIQQYVGELEITELRLDVYYKLGKKSSIVYEDGQDGYDYLTGSNSIRNFNLIGKEDSLVIQQFQSGKFTTSYQDIEINLIGLPFEKGIVEVDNEIIDYSQIESNIVRVSKDFTEIKIYNKYCEIATKND